MRWKIVIEPKGGAAPGEEWTATGETFEGDADALGVRLAELQAATGRCHGAEMVMAD